MVAAGVTTAGADNNQQKAAAGAAKMADVAAAGAEVALAAKTAAAAAVELWQRQQLKRPRRQAAGIAMEMAEGKMRGRGDKRDRLGVCRTSLGVPQILLGNYFTNSRAMFIENAYLDGSQFWCLEERGLSAPQINLSACADKQMVILYVYLRAEES